jgi:hypothetical protein
MKIAKLLFGTLFISAAFVASSQEETEQERECKRMRFLAGEELKIKNYAAATAYYVKGEKICGGYDKANYDRMIGTISNTIATETDKAKKSAYIDTLVGVYERTEEKGVYDVANDLKRATYIIQASKPNRAKADELYARGIHKEGTSATEAHISYYYYNMYNLFTEAAADKKPAMKQRLITEYFFLSKLISTANMSVKAQENLTTYFNGVVKSCDDILPDLKGFMSSFPQEVEAKKATVNNFISLLESKNCTLSKEYEMLIDTLIKIDPSIGAVEAKAKLLTSKKKYSEAIGAYKEAKGMTADADKKDELDYRILVIMYNDQNSYKSAYNAALNASGKYKSESLKIAAQCVANMANGCGSSTFERKCNYIYAAQLADRAGEGGLAAKYRAAGPSQDEVFENGGASTVSLSCWGVTVSVK